MVVTGKSIWEMWDFFMLAKLLPVSDQISNGSNNKKWRETHQISQPNSNPSNFHLLPEKSHQSSVGDSIRERRPFLAHIIED
jgi:hypothetical protein